jgi:hypothetical protein
MRASVPQSVRLGQIALGIAPQRKGDDPGVGGEQAQPRPRERQAAQEVPRARRPAGRDSPPQQAQRNQRSLRGWSPSAEAPEALGQRRIN